MNWRETEWENEILNIMFKRHLVECEKKKIQVIFHVEYLIFAIGNDAPHFHHGSLSNNRRWCTVQLMAPTTTPCWVCLATYITQEDALWCECNSIYSPKRGKLIESTMHVHDKSTRDLWMEKRKCDFLLLCFAVLYFLLLYVYRIRRWIDWWMYIRSGLVWINVDGSTKAHF